jgi:hypothetical protein
MSDFEDQETDEESQISRTEFRPAISSMYAYLDSLERPSLLLEETILEMEAELTRLYKKGQAKGWEDVIVYNLLEAATIASSLAWSIDNEGDNRSKEFYRNFHALRTTLNLLLEG